MVFYFFYPNFYPKDLLKRCPNGFECSQSNLKLKKEGIIAYLENDVRHLKEHKGIFCFFSKSFGPCVNFIYFLVYSSNYTGNCQCETVFEGQNALLLNFKNKYFVHYSLLIEHSEFMTASRNPLYSFLR